MLSLEPNFLDYIGNEIMLLQNSITHSIPFNSSYSFFNSCVLSEYANKTKDAIVKGSSFVGEKGKSAYDSTKEKLGFEKRNPQKVKPMSVAMTKFGEMPDGTTVKKYTLSNANGMRVGILDYGGTVKEIFAPDRNGNFQNVSLGFDNLDDYREKKVHTSDVLPEGTQIELPKENSNLMEMIINWQLTMNPITCTAGIVVLTNMFGIPEY